MGTMGTLERMATADLDRLLGRLVTDYHPGALEALSLADPAWRAELEQAEREVGGLYEALQDADATLAQWREAVTHLGRLWERVVEARGAMRETTLDRVA